MAGLNTLMKSEYRDLLVTSVVSTEKKYKNNMLNNQHSHSTVVFCLVFFVFCFFLSRYNSGMSVNSVYACVNVARHIVLVCDNIIY